MYYYHHHHCCPRLLRQCRLGCLEGGHYMDIQGIHGYCRQQQFLMDQSVTIIRQHNYSYSWVTPSSWATETTCKISRCINLQTFPSGGKPESRTIRRRRSRDSQDNCVMIPVSDCPAIFIGTFSARRFFRWRLLPGNVFGRLALISCHGMHRSQWLVLGRSTDHNAVKSVVLEAIIVSAAVGDWIWFSVPSQYDSVSELPRRLLLHQFLALFLLLCAHLLLIFDACLEAFDVSLECIAVLRTADAHQL